MSATIVLSALAGLLAVYYYYYVKKPNTFKVHGIPYQTTLQGLYAFIRLLFRRTSAVSNLNEIYHLQHDAKYVGIYDFTQPLLVLRDPELIKVVTVKNFEIFPDRRSLVDQTQDPLLSKNLAALQGQRWREVRGILSPSFTSSKMKNMYVLMSECGVNFVNYLTQLSGDKKASMDIRDAFTRYTTDVIATCAFGINVDSMRNPKNEFYVFGKEMSAFGYLAFLKIMFVRYAPNLARKLGITFIRKEIQTFFHNLVEETVNARDENGIVRQDMLQLMMENRESQKGKTKLDIDDMVSQAFIFFFGGFETSSTIMCYIAHEIAVNREVHDRLQSEIDSVLSKGAPTYEIINSMEYLDAVINETLRKYPIGVLLDRLCVKDFELPPTLPGSKPYTVKKGENLWVHVYGLHRDPKYFPEPEKFDPDRFLGEQKKRNLNSGAYLPFGIGPRMCIGNRFALLETKVLFFHLLARCDLKPCEKTEIPIKIQGFNMRPDNGFWLEVSSRKNAHPNISLISSRT